MNGPLGLVAKGPGHRAWWFASGNLCPWCHPPGPAVLTTRKAGAEPALSGCRTLSASIPIPRRAEILAVPRRESDDPTLPRVAGSKEWPNRALSYAVALSVPLTGRVEVSVCSPLLTATPQQRPCRAHFRHGQSATRPRMLPPQSTSPLNGTAIVAVLRFTRQRPSNVRWPWWASQLLPLPASLTSGPHACGSQGRACAERPTCPTASRQCRESR
jgi:hypothetical protein